MVVNFPNDCTTDASRMAWCYRAQEKLRKFHNVMGAWFKTGIPEATWDKLPAKARIRYPYKAKLTAAEWRDFKDKVFDKLDDAITTAMLANRALAKDSTYWPVDLNGDIA